MGFYMSWDMITTANENAQHDRFALVCDLWCRADVVYINLYGDRAAFLRKQGETAFVGSAARPAPGARNAVVVLV